MLIHRTRQVLVQPGQERLLVEAHKLAAQRCAAGGHVGGVRPERVMHAGKRDAGVVALIRRQHHVCRVQRVHVVRRQRRALLARRRRALGAVGRQQVHRRRPALLLEVRLQHRQAQGSRPPVGTPTLTAAPIAHDTMPPGAGVDTEPSPT